MLVITINSSTQPQSKSSFDDENPFVFPQTSKNARDNLIYNGTETEYDESMIKMFNTAVNKMKETNKTRISINKWSKFDKL